MNGGVYLNWLEHFTYLSTPGFGMVWCLLNIGECEIAWQMKFQSVALYLRGNSPANRQ